MIGLLDRMNNHLIINFFKLSKHFSYDTFFRSPIVVHCLTGAGRGGTFAALDIICRKMDFTEKLPNGPLVDVKDTVMRIRTQRDMAVLKPEQYVFLHLMVVEYALRQKYYDDIDFIDLSNYTNSEQ